MDKEEIRKTILSVRGALDLEFIEESSCKIIDVFINAFSDYNTFLLYYDFKKEVRTGQLIERLLDLGKKVYLPMMEIESEVGIGSYDGVTDLKMNRHGIMEPLSASDKNSFDVAVIPGVVFDKKCNRIGFGSGFYDRLLTKIHVSQSIGFAYEAQIIDELHSEAHDYPMDCVITERNLYRRTT